MSGVINTLLGSGGAPDTITLDATYNPVASGSGSQTATFTLQSDGDILINVVDGGDNWIDPVASAPGLYEVKAEIVSGTPGVGSAATGTWLALTSDRLWRVIDATNNGLNVVCVLTIEIRHNGGSVLASTTVTLEANRTS